MMCNLGTRNAGHILTGPLSHDSTIISYRRHRLGWAEAEGVLTLLLRGWVTVRRLPPARVLGTEGVAGRAPCSMVPYVLRLAVALLLPTLATGDAAEGVPAGGAKSPSAWTGAEVGEWLFEQGLGPYRDAFAAHGIDGHHLLALRDHAMKETFNMEGCASQPHPRTGGGVGRVLSGAYQSCVPQLTAPRYEKPPQGCARVFWTHLRISGTRCAVSRVRNAGTALSLRCG